MNRWMSAVFVLVMGAGCSPAGDGSSAPSAAQASPEVFVGGWRSVTPTLEFVRLTVHSKSSEMGVLGARLTFSGVFWEGGGRIEGDSLVVAMAIVGASGPTAEFVARARDGGTLLVRMGPENATATAFTFVRDD